MSTTTLVTLPLLTLLSIPLTITASITIFFSTIALFLQLLVVSIELCCALLANLFTIPPSSNWSLLSFTVSGPNTPDRRRSSDYGLLHHPLTFRTQSHPSLGPRTGSSNPLDLDSQDTTPFYNLDSHRPNLQRNKPYTQSSGFLGLVSGHEDRDFEGLGGWRCPPSNTKSLGYRSGRTTPSSKSVSDEIDDIAWLSINSRLELPSQPLMLRHGSNSGHNHKDSIHSNTSTTEPYVPRRKNSRVAVSAAPDPKRTKGPRHHRRAATTSMISGFGVRSPNSQVLSRHDLPHGQTIVHWKGAAPRSQSHISLYEHRNRHARLRPDTANSYPGLGDYFALQPKSGGSGAKTTSNTTPNEERKPAKAAATNFSVAGLAQYMPSLGSR
ncbi:hypothetical protein BDW59DRAFT_61038 [Aspergillus cavernicola]|uniref:Pal1-domain-containing protein n=1 Tax=Aspergillus cavernicola TaxID=176166 RepID=A0ABR4IGG0_9EURO